MKVAMIFAVLLSISAFAATGTVVTPPANVDPGATKAPPVVGDSKMIERAPDIGTEKPLKKRNPVRAGSKQRSAEDDCKGMAQHCKQNSAR